MDAIKQFSNKMKEHFQKKCFLTIMFIVGMFNESLGGLCNVQVSERELNRCFNPECEMNATTMCDRCKGPKFCSRDCSIKSGHFAFCHSISEEMLVNYKRLFLGLKNVIRTGATRVRFIPAETMALMHFFTQSNMRMQIANSIFLGMVNSDYSGLEFANVCPILAFMLFHDICLNKINLDHDSLLFLQIKEWAQYKSMNFDIVLDGRMNISEQQVRINKKQWAGEIDYISVEPVHRQSCKRNKCDMESVIVDQGDFFELKLTRNGRNVTGWDLPHIWCVLHCHGNMFKYKVEVKSDSEIAGELYYNTYDKPNFPGMERFLTIPQDLEKVRSVARKECDELGFEMCNGHIIPEAKCDKCKTIYRNIQDNYIIQEVKSSNAFESVETYLSQIEEPNIFEKWGLPYELSAIIQRMCTVPLSMCSKKLHLFYHMFTLPRFNGFNLSEVEHFANCEHTKVTSFQVMRMLEISGKNTMTILEQNEFDEQNIHDVSLTKWAKRRNCYDDFCNEEETWKYSRLGRNAWENMMKLGKGYRPPVIDLSSSNTQMKTPIGIFSFCNTQVVNIHFGHIILMEFAYLLDHSHLKYAAVDKFLNVISVGQYAMAVFSKQKSRDVMLLRILAELYHGADFDKTQALIDEYETMNARKRFLDWKKVNNW